MTEYLSFQSLAAVKLEPTTLRLGIERRNRSCTSTVHFKRRVNWFDIAGMTPQRREFHYPRILDKTQRHSLLLQDFRKDYDMNMAMETPLPDDSFTSQVSTSRGYN